MTMTMTTMILFTLLRPKGG